MIMVHGIMPIFPASLVWGIGSFSLRNDPNAFTPEDQRDMHYARAILHGEDVQAQWCGMIAPLAAPAVDNLLAQVEQHGDPFSFTAAVRRRYRWPEASYRPAGGRRRAADLTIRLASSPSADVSVILQRAATVSARPRGSRPHDCCQRRYGL